MDLLQLIKENFKLTNLNVRTERHGDEEVGAADINFEADVANNYLTKFSDDLRECLYKQDSKSTADMLNPDFAPNLRNPKMGPIAWDLTINNGTLELHDDDDLGYFHCGTVKAGKFVFTCKEGGTVHLKYRVQISEPSPQLIAVLYQLQGKVVKISLIQEAAVELPATQHNGEGNPNVLPLFGDKPESEPEHEQTDEEREADEEARLKAQGIDDAIEFDLAYAQAVELLNSSNNVSVSIISRQLKVENDIAMRILAKLEDENLIGEESETGLHEVKAA